MALYHRWYAVIGFVCCFNIFLLFHISQPQRYFLILKRATTLSSLHSFRSPSSDYPVFKDDNDNRLVHHKDPVPLLRISPRTPLRVIPVVVMACNRITVSRCLDKILKYRPSSAEFPVIVSQDCGHKMTSNVIKGYHPHVIHIKQPNLTNFILPPKQKNFQGYYKISRHYKWALDQIFFTMNYSSVIIVEDDLDIAADFFEYFSATLPILESDPSLWCVSAWNDNGKPNIIEDNPELLFRTDFFPGLGWMLLKRNWLELRRTWPTAFWDDFLRQKDVRKGRSCIRPEISRATTFGRKGISNGQHYDKFLRYIKLNTHYIPFTMKNITYLHQSEYDKRWKQIVYKDARPVSVDALASLSFGPVIVRYTNKAEFLTIVKKLGAMADFKGGIPRTAYRGVIPLVANGYRVYVAPTFDWHDYDPKWT